MDIYDDMLVTSGDDDPSYNVEKNCLAEFKFGKIALSMSIVQDIQKTQHVLTRKPS